MKRPIRTEYFAAGKDTEPAALGHSCSERGSVRGAVVRIFMNEYARARVTKDGVPLFTICRNGKDVQVRYGRS